MLQLYRKNYSRLHSYFSIAVIVFSANTYAQLGDREGNSALHYAVHDLEILNKVLEFLNDDPEGLIKSLEVKNQWGSTPLHTAIFLGNQNCALVILNKMLELKMDVGEANAFGQTSLHEAMQNNNEDVCSWYMKNAPETYKKVNLGNHANARAIARGSQGDAYGPTELEKVYQYYYQLESSQPLGIKFNFEKINDYIEGGNCTAMSLDLAANYLQMKRECCITEQTLLSDLIDEIQISGKKI